MAQFIAFDPNVEVLGGSISKLHSSLPTPESRARLTEFLKISGIESIDAHAWYKQQILLNAYKLVSELLGPATLFLIGKSVPEAAVFPPGIDSLEKALTMLNEGYKMNHRKGEIGYYKVVSFDSAKRISVVECRNPYPSHFDRGIIMTFLRRFKPKDSIKYDVFLDEKKPSRLNGGESCFYNITW
jgi:hypothetical protein